LTVVGWLRRSTRTKERKHKEDPIIIIEVSLNELYRLKSKLDNGGTGVPQTCLAHTLVARLGLLLSGWERGQKAFFSQLLLLASGMARACLGCGPKIDNLCGIEPSSQPFRARTP
jgi:hypothetical protein